MEISLLCGVDVILSIVDKKEKNILYISEETNPEAFVDNFVTQNIINKTFVSNKNVKLFNTNKVLVSII